MRVGLCVLFVGIFAAAPEPVRGQRWLERVPPPAPSVSVPIDPRFQRAVRLEHLTEAQRARLRWERRRLLRVDPRCERSFYSTDDQWRCTNTIREVPERAVVLPLCVREMRTNRDRLNCLRIAADSATIRECIRHFSGRTNQLSCMARHPTPAVVRACVRHFAGAHMELRCIAADRGLADVVRCGQRTGGRAQMVCLASVEESTARDTASADPATACDYWFESRTNRERCRELARSPGQVAACGRWFERSNERLQCLEAIDDERILDACVATEERPRARLECLRAHRE